MGACVGACVGAWVRAWVRGCVGGFVGLCVCVFVAHWHVQTIIVYYCGILWACIFAVGLSNFSFRKMISLPLSPSLHGRTVLIARVITSVLGSWYPHVILCV